MRSYAAGVFRGCWGAGNRRGVYGVAAGSAQRARADGAFGVLCAALGPRELRGAHTVVAGLACRARVDGLARQARADGGMARRARVDGRLAHPVQCWSSWVPRRRVATAGAPPGKRAIFPVQEK